MSESDLTKTIFEGHEDRLQKMEGDVQQISTNQATLSANQQHIAEKQDEMLSTMKAYHGTLSEKLDTMSESIVDNHQQISKRLAPIEKLEDRRKARWNLTKKFIIPVLAAAAGVFGNKFGEELLKWLLGS